MTIRMTKQYILLIGIILLSAFAFVYFTKKQNGQLKSYLDNYDFTTGRITYYHISILHSPGTYNSVYFKYEVNGNIYENNYQSIFYKIPNSKPDLTKNFLVVYNTMSPEKSIIMTDYPVEDKRNLERIIQTLSYEQIVNWRK